MEGRGSVGEGEEDMKCPNCGACTTGNYCIADSIIQQTRVDCPNCGEVVLYRWPDNGEWTTSRDECVTRRRASRSRSTVAAQPNSRRD